MQGNLCAAGSNIRKFQITVKSSDFSMIYLPVEFERFPLVLTFCDAAQFTVAQRIL